MKNGKTNYVNGLRGDTVYPVYRGVIGIITIVLMVLAALQALGALIGGFALMQYSSLLGLVAMVMGGTLGVLGWYLARFWNEASAMLADIADVVVSASSRTPAEAEKLVAR